MNREQFEEVKNQEIGNGQFFTIEARTQSGFSASAKKSNYFKVSKFQSHVFVKSFSELVNTSTGMQELNADYQPEQESLYDSQDYYLNQDHYDPHAADTQKIIRESLSKISERLISLRSML